MKYRDRVITTVAFERPNLAAYKRAALEQGVDFSEWINKLCARACKPDARVITHRDRKAARQGE